MSIGALAYLIEALSGFMGGTNRWRTMPWLVVLFGRLCDMLGPRKTLLAGFTTVRNLGSEDGVTLALRDAIARGWAVGPRIVDAGTSISTTTGHMDPTLGMREEFHDALLASGSTCDGANDCRRAVRRQIARGADVIKIATTGGVNSRIGLGLGAQMFEDEVRAIVETAHLYGRRVAVHAHGADGIVLALRAGADSIEHGTLLDEEAIRLFRQTGAYYVPTLSTVNGPAVTGGLELALACDFRIASERARFADTHARMGIMPGWGLTVLLPEAVGYRRAKELSTTGNFLDPHTALTWGLVNHVVPHHDLVPFAQQLAADIASNDQAGVRRMKQTYDEGALVPGAEAWALEGRVAGEWQAGGRDSADLEARRRAVTERGRSQV